MGLLLKEIAEMVNGTVRGGTNVEITGISGIREAQKGDISFVAGKKYAPLIAETKATALIVSKDITDAPIPMIQVDDPDLAFAKVVEYFLPEPLTFYKGIHPTAVIGEDVSIGEGVSIQAFSVIQDGCHIDDGTIIYPGVYVGHSTKIGKNCLIYPRVVIRERVVVGNNVIIHSGAVIGSDGFGYYTVEGVHHKIPQIGIVELEDDVEIGANVTIERARFDKTLIGKGTKVSNLVEIAHNVRIGENSVIIALSALAGSSKIGNNVILAAQSGVDGHVEIGDNVLVGARSGVTKSIPSNSRVSGFPAQSHEKELKERAMQRHLSDMVQTVRQLQDEVGKMKERITKLDKKSKDNT